MNLTNGYDGTVEELYFANAVADWENVVTPMVDFALTLPDVDPAKLVLHGWSFGGYLAP